MITCFSEPLCRDLTQASAAENQAEGGARKGGGEAGQAGRGWRVAGTERSGTGATLSEALILGEHLSRTLQSSSVYNHGDRSWKTFAKGALNNEGCV